MQHKFTILITGGSGFIGRQLVDSLIQDPSVVELRLLTRTPSAWHLSQYRNKVVRLCKGDIQHINDLKSYMADVNILFHLAAITPPASQTVPYEFLNAVNSQATINLAMIAASAGVDKFIHFSTTGIYGYTSGTLLKESSRCSPPNAFEQSKLSAELGLTMLASGTPMKIIILRPSNVIGEAQPRKRLLPLIRAVLKGHMLLTRPPGYQNLVYIRDVTEAAHSLALHHDMKSSQVIFNVNCPIPNEELIRELSRILEVKCRIWHAPLPIIKTATSLTALGVRALPSKLRNVPEKLRQLIDFRIYDPTALSTELPEWPAFGLRTALLRTVNYYRNRSWI